MATTSSAAHDVIRAANRKYFDARAEKYSQNAAVLRVTRQIVDAMLKRPDLIPFNEESTRLLDYACGSGAVSQGLMPHVASIVGLDISEGMVKTFNTAASNQGLEASEMIAYQLDLCVPPAPPTEALAALSLSETSETTAATADNYAVFNAYEPFDAAVCVMAYHHIPEPGVATKAIAARLKKGGVFVVADFSTRADFREWGKLAKWDEEQIKSHGGSAEAHSHGHSHSHEHSHSHGHGHEHSHGHGHSHGHSHGDKEGECEKEKESPFTMAPGHKREDVVPHVGFSEKQITEWFVAAGLGEPEFIEVTSKGGQGTSVLAVDDDNQMEVLVKRSIFMAVGKKA